MTRDVIAVTGPDAGTYLQGQLSQDVLALEPGTSAWSLLLEPNGKLGSWLRVTRTGDDAFLLDVDAGFAEAVTTRLSRFKIRTVADIVPATGELPGSVQVDLVEGEAERIEAGVPKMGAEIVDDVIPGELGPWLIERSVSFTKGCYTGQELVARVDSRGGNVPRHLRGLVVDGDAVPPVGAELVLSPGADADADAAKVVGKITSSARSTALGAPVALGFVHRSVEPAARVVVRWEGGAVPATVAELPLRPDLVRP